MRGHYNREPEVRATIAQVLGESRYQLWFGEGVRVGLDPDERTLEIGVPNGYFRDWIRDHYGGAVSDAVRELVGRPIALEFHLGDDPAAEKSKAEAVAVGPAQEAVPGPPPAPAPIPSPTSNRPLGRPPKRLDDFVVGPSNQLAHAAAVEMGLKVGATFNPLVLHGEIGLGKTHLLEGIATAIRAKHPGLRVLHMTAEMFTNRFLEAMRGQGLQNFRTRHRAADVLLIDDVHFLAAKRATQDEFLHTYNALIQDGAAIVMTCDQHPRQVPRLANELVTRFLGGMVVRITLPDLGTRREILRSKARARGIEVPEPVLAFIAEHIRTSVRELEGALHSVIAHAVLGGRRIDLSLARLALRDLIRHTAPNLAMKDVERAVAQLFHIEPEQLRSEGRSRAVSYPRMLAMYLSRKKVGTPYSEIGRYFGGRNHSTVIAAEKRVESWIQSGKKTRGLPGFDSPADALAAIEQALGA